MLRSLMGKIKIALSLAAQTISATTLTASVDNQGFGSLMFTIAAGAFSYTGSNKVSITVQDSDDNTTFADVPASSIYKPESGAIAKILDATADGAAVHNVHYLGEKRYVRLNLVVAGTVSAILAVSTVQGNPNLAPPA